MNASSYLIQGCPDDIIATNMRPQAKQGCIAGSETISDACVKHIVAYCDDPLHADEFPDGFQGCLDDLGMSRKQFEFQVRRAFESYKQMFHRENVRIITIGGRSKRTGLFTQKNFTITRSAAPSRVRRDVSDRYSRQRVELWFREVFFKIVRTLDKLITYETKVSRATHMSIAPTDTLRRCFSSPAAFSAVCGW